VQRIVPLFAGEHERRPSTEAMFAQASVAAGRVELRASELEGWIRKRHAPMRAPGAASLSSRPRHESTTGGARADRVGVKLSSRAIVSRRARRRKLPGPWPVKPRLESRQIVTGLGPWRFQCSFTSLLEDETPPGKQA
jgi:hypothetical protein